MKNQINLTKQVKTHEQLLRERGLGLIVRDILNANGDRQLYHDAAALVNPIYKSIIADPESCYDLSILAYFAGLIAVKEAIQAGEMDTLDSKYLDNNHGLLGEATEVRVLFWPNGPEEDQLPSLKTLSWVIKDYLLPRSEQVLGRYGKNFEEIVELLAPVREYAERRS